MDRKLHRDLVETPGQTQHHHDAGGDHVALMSTLSAQAQAALLAEPLSAELAEALTVEAQASLAEQARIEAADTMPFEQYRQAYLSPERLGLGRKPPAGC